MINTRPVTLLYFTCTRDEAAVRCPFVVQLYTRLLTHDFGRESEREMFSYDAYVVQTVRY